MQHFDFIILNKKKLKKTDSIEFNVYVCEGYNEIP